MKVKMFLYRLIAFLIIQASFLSLNAQTLNLVQNPSFEDSLGCPADVNCGAIYQVVNWYNVDFTPCPNTPPPYYSSSPDYFNPCGQGTPPSQSQKTPNNCLGTQYGYNNSDSYAGFYSYRYNQAFLQNYREYIGTALLDTLKLNKQYILKMYVSLADFANYATDGIGMNLSSSLIQINNNGYNFQVWACLSNLFPQLISTTPITDKIYWVPITTTITAQGGEKYLTIGCFKDDNNINAVLVDTLHFPNSYYYVDQVSITPINFAGPDVSVCPGSCTTLNANIGNFNIGYQWSSNPAGFTSTSPTPTVCPTVQTTYTVTATDANGGTATDAVIVSIKAAPPKPIFAGPFNTCHGNTNYYVTNYSSNYTYYYTIGLNGTHHSFSNGGSFYVNWPISGGGVLYVNATDNTTGCTTRDSLKVFDCCDVYRQGVPLPRYKDTIFTTAPSIPQFVINGILTINGSFSFNTKTIYLGPNAKIIVNPSRTLTISASTYLQAGCDTMWDGIYLNDPTSALNVTSSYIFDAKNAIISNACATYTITNSTMDRNYRNIVVQSCSGMNNSTISGSLLTCNTTSNPFLPQYPPIAATRTYSGIEISNVSSIAVGNTASAANRNHFNNMDFGIKNYVSTLTVNNNTFSNMTATGVPSFPPTSGVGIISTSDKSYQKSLTIGGPAGSINTNRFEYCYQGIYADYFQNVTIQRDTFLSTGQWNSIYLYNHPAKTIKILNNVITDGLAGIWFNECSGSTTDINSNSISNNFYGILAQNVNPDGVLKLNIYDNRIWNNTYGNGIWVTNIQGVQGSQTQIALISNNYVYINNPDFNLPYTSNGILVENSPYAFIQVNSVSKSSGSISDSTSAKKLNGIYVQLSPNSDICQNSLLRMGCGLRFFGTMPNTKLKRNAMSINYYYGIRLDNANIGRQGDTTYAWRNSWVTTSSNYRVQGTPSVLTKWNYDGLLNPNNPYCPVPNSVSPFNYLQLLNKTSFITTCAIPVQLPLSMQYNPIVNNNYDYILTPDENRYWDKQYFYNDMQSSPSLLSSLALSNTNYQSFYYTIDNSNIGEFARVNALMNTEDYVNAEIRNAAISPTNDIEKNRQIVNRIYLDTWAKHRFEFTNDERTTLENIALQSPLLEGNAVYSARVMLGITVQSTSTVKRMNQNTTNAINSVGSIYPNPAKEIAYLDYSFTEGQTAYLYFYNTMGTPVKSFIINSQSNRFEFSTKDFKTGLYFYIIVLSNNQLLESNKLIIIK